MIISYPPPGGEKKMGETRVAGAMRQRSRTWVVLAFKLGLKKKANRGGERRYAIQSLRRDGATTISYCI
jgi:hypothetical protein